MDYNPPRRGRLSWLHLDIGTAASSFWGHRNDDDSGGSTATSFGVLPTFLLTPPTISGHNRTKGSSEPKSHLRKFSFASLSRRLSNTTLNRTDSMVSLSYKPIITFITEDDLNGLQSFLENKRIVVDDRDENGATALHYAASKGKLNFVRELLDHNADVNIEDNDNWTALLCAAKEGYTDICAELLDRDAQIEHRDMGGWSALMWASYRGHTETTSLLLERGADVNAHGNYHISSLLWAAGRDHTEIARALIQHSAKVNMGDKYGTTALVWASRRGNVAIVDMLLKAGANVDTAGMNSWTPLLVATMGNHIDVVTSLLACRPNINAVDKDGFTALTIASKEGYTEIATALLNVGAYINIQDRGGDTNLIHAVKGGHRSIVEALLKKYADVDIPGKEKKTATYNAVEKGNIPILKSLLNANPDLEISTKEGDTPLLRAVRSRNAEAVQLLLEKKAKVNAADRWGDTSLHIAMRARSKAIVEILLRNPKNSQLLYRPNRAGETPYNIDMSHNKTILGQIFGARRLNTNEDNENLLGYDLYSSALADMLSEPSLSMPITVGLYAKWGSGKSFLLNKLREEMKNFARQWMEPAVRFSWLLLAMICHFSAVVGLIVGLTSFLWLAGLLVGLSIILLTYLALVLLWCGNQRYNWDILYNLHMMLMHKMNTVKIVLQVMFCHPPGNQWSDSLTAMPIKFYFTDQTRVSSTAAGESAIVQMIGSLYDSIESDYGSLACRLYRAFHTKPIKSTSSWRFRRTCCLPNVIVFEACFICLLILVSTLAIYLIELQLDPNSVTVNRTTCLVIISVTGCVVLLAVVANAYKLAQVFMSLLFSQRRCLQKSISRVHAVKAEGFLQALRTEVTLMTDMVKCLDAFTQQQTRLVIVVDGLDSSEQDKVLFVLDSVHLLFSDANSPFIIILAIDPHIISKAVEITTRVAMSDSNIGGHDYLRNMVHLPFYLQNSGLRKVQIAQKTATRTSSSRHQQQLELGSETSLGRSGSLRRLSTETSNQEKYRNSSKRNSSRKLKLSESIASSLGSNLNKAGGPLDLTKMLLTDDYFSDVNPRSMRRLMNVVYITGRLLKAFQIDFNWYHLASWINITEQWPYRTSWIILYHDTSEENIDDNVSLKNIYDKVRNYIPTSKESEPLLELDRDEKKLDVFLTYHRCNLMVADMRIFLPFTINLDPYIKKVIKDELQNLEESGLNPMPANWPINMQDNFQPNKKRNDMFRRQKSATVKMSNVLPNVTPIWPPSIGVSASTWSPNSPNPVLPGINLNRFQSSSPWQSLPRTPAVKIPRLSSELLDVKLDSLNVQGICQLFQKLPDLQQSQISNYVNIVQQHNINGKVLMYCDLDELKQVLKMSFGDWEIFRMTITGLREVENARIIAEEHFPLSNRPYLPNSRYLVKNSISGDTPIASPSNNQTSSQSRTTEKERVTKASTVEKQVTLEEQMICGALQTLNEEACEDVLEEHEPNLNLNLDSDQRLRHNSTGESSQIEIIIDCCSDLSEDNPD